MQTKDESKKQNILTAVAKMIVKGGVESVTISQVAKRAGVSKGTVYVYFDDKLDLLRQTYQVKRQHYNDYLADHVRQSGTPVERLDSFITSLYQFGSKYTDDMLVIDAVVSSHLRADIFPNGQEPPSMINPWNDLLSAGEKTGDFKHISPYGLNFFIFHAISGYIKDLHYHNLDQDEVSFDQLKSLLMTGIKS